MSPTKFRDLDGIGAEAFIVGPDDPILVTGASGFIGSRLVRCLLDRGFRNVTCFVRPSSNVTSLEASTTSRVSNGQVTIFKGNLLSRDDCSVATQNIRVIFHLAAGGSAKSFPDAFMNCVIATRNLLNASLEHRSLKRFVNVSSFVVYDNSGKRPSRVLDESCPVEARPALRGDAYCYAKTKQDELLMDYGQRFKIPYVIVRPGSVYGPGKEEITSRVGIDTFGVFLHLGGSNLVPFTYVDNCAEAIALAGLKQGIDGEVFNVVDDDLPSSRRFLRLYKRNVRHFNSIYVPHALSYLLCYLWERYSAWSEGQLPPAFNRKRWHALWRKTRYSNHKLKTRLCWEPRVSIGEGLANYFQDCRRRGHDA